MKNKEKIILMYEDDEVLSFEVDYEKERATILEKLEHFDKAPNGVKDIDVHSNTAFMKFINSRSIAPQRYDYKEILEATNSKSYFDLSFKGHGLSLTNNYWYKREGENLSYKDINFFNNKWDDSFAKAVINHDYEALKNCDLNVPDIMTSGWGCKGWICTDEGPKLYKLGINKDHSEEALTEVLSSRLANRIFKEGECLKYELEKVGNQYASVSPLITNIDEELVPLSDYVNGEIYLLYRNKNYDKKLGDEFFNRIKNSEITGLYEFFVKVACLRDLCFVNDLHFDNISLIKNRKTGEIRLAPLYDLGSSFGSSRTGQSLIASPTKATLIMVYYVFSGLDPNWDYSWYDPDKLIGFEDEIRETLSKSDFYNEALINTIIEVYHHQKEVLDEMARKSKK